MVGPAATGGSAGGVARAPVVARQLVGLAAVGLDRMDAVQQLEQQRLLLRTDPDLAVLRQPQRRERQPAEHAVDDGEGKRQHGEKR